MQTPSASAVVALVILPCSRTYMTSVFATLMVISASCFDPIEIAVTLFAAVSPSLSSKTASSA